MFPILSRRPLEDRQRILKDSHTGAFAVISIVFYILAYFAFAMLRARTGVPIGHSDKLYPYPFLDYPRLGAKRFWLYVTGILAFFFALGCLFVGIGSWLT
mgnify:CR=1 FL=1